MPLASLVLLLGGCGLLPGAKTVHPHVIGTLSLDSLKPGDRILRMDSGEGAMPAEANDYMALSSSTGVVPLDSMKQLEGHVVIANAKQALDFARLTTRCGIADPLEGGGEMEITTPEGEAHMPTYGWIADSPDLTTSKSGYGGVLSPQAFQEGGFQMPLITPTALGYRITRWTFDVRSVKEIQEEVGGDGFYQRRVLRQMPPPKLPRTTWGGGPGVS